MTSSWQKPRSESKLNCDAVESLEYRPIMLSEDRSEEVGAREDEDFSKNNEDQHQELGTSCHQSSSVSRRIDEQGLPFKCPLLLIDDDSLCNTDGSMNSTSTKSVLIEGEKRCTSEGYLFNSALGRCNNLLAAEIETVDIQVPLEGATQPQQETIDDLPLLVDGDRNPEKIAELISDAMEGCYVNVPNYGQLCETVPSCPIERECWDTQPINCDVITDVLSPETSCRPESEEEDIVILATEFLQDEFPGYAIQEDSEVLMSNNDKQSATLLEEQKENKPRAKDCPFICGTPENVINQTRVSDKSSDQNSNAQSYSDNCIFDPEEWNPNTPSGQQPTVQWDAEEEVWDNEIDDVKGTCLDITSFRPVYTTGNKPASHGTPFIESLAPPMCLSLHQAPHIEARGYHSEGHIEETECDRTVYTSSSESTTSSAAFVKAMNLRNRQKSNIFENPLKDEENDLGAVFKLGEAKQDPSHKFHGDFLKESIHSDEKTSSEMSEMLPCPDSNRADDVDLKGTNGGPVSPDQTDALITPPEVTVHPPPDIGDGTNQRNEYHQIVGRRGLEDSNETNNEIIRPGQSDGQDQHIVRESNDLNNDPVKHCVQNTGSRKIASTDCNIPPQVKFGVLQTPSTKPVEDEVDSESGQVAKDHQKHPSMSPRPFDQPGHLPRHDNNLTRVGGARSPSRKVERLRRRELYRMTREVVLQKERCERMHQDALRSVDEFNLVRQEVSRLYNRLDNSQTNFEVNSSVR